MKAWGHTWEPDGVVGTAQGFKVPFRVFPSDLVVSVSTAAHSVQAELQLPVPVQAVKNLEVQCMFSHIVALRAVEAGLSLSCEGGHS